MTWLPDDLSTRAKNILRNEGITDRQGVRDMTIGQLVRTPNVGWITALEILTIAAGWNTPEPVRMSRFMAFIATQKKVKKK
jgi:DNA-directed RNA polymerase alpha subunit